MYRIELFKVVVFINWYQVAIWLIKKNKDMKRKNVKVDWMNFFGKKT